MLKWSNLKIDSITLVNALDLENCDIWAVFLSVKKYILPFPYGGIVNDVGLF